MKNSLAEIDALIVAGRGGLARLALRKLPRETLPRELLAESAALAWRAGLPELGLKFLAPWVRPDPRHPRAASPEEKAEYAQCLVKCGALEEAGILLAELEGIAAPGVQLARASWHVAHWDYAGSIPILAALVGRRDLTSYARLVAKVNLAAALVYERRGPQADPLLRELLHDSHLRGFRLMLGRVLELTAEGFIGARDWKRAESFLAESKHQLSQSAGLDELFTRKLAAVTELGQDPKSRAARGLLRAIRAEAQTRGHWETVRDCDRREAVIRKDERLLARLYFGTPFPHYRARLLADYGEHALPASFAWSAGSSRQLDLMTGRIENGPTLIPGSAPHRLVVALTSELYRPMRLVTLFSKLHPGTHFNPATSPALVHNTVTRFRAWCERERVPLAVEASKGEYRLIAREGLGILLHSSQSIGRRHSPELAGLRVLWPSDAFSVGDALRALGLPRRTLSRILNDAQAEGLLHRTGEKRGTKYRFKK